MEDVTLNSKINKGEVKVESSITSLKDTIYESTVNIKSFELDSKIKKE